MADGNKIKRNNSPRAKILQRHQRQFLFFTGLAQGGKSQFLNDGRWKMERVIFLLRHFEKSEREILFPRKIE